MSDTTPFAFGKLIPGFDFLQQLAQAPAAGGAAAPGLGHWIAPTVNVQELEQRISELKTVQFWLEQNLLAVKATVQALEVQKMTLQTLHGMNLNLGEVAQAFAMPTAARKKAGTAAGSDRGKPSSRGGEAPAGASKKAPPAADPMQWWGALTQQFQQIALQALTDAAARATPPAGDEKPAARKTAAPRQEPDAEGGAARSRARPQKRKTAAGGRKAAR